MLNNTNTCRLPFLSAIVSSVRRHDAAWRLIPARVQTMNVLRISPTLWGGHYGKRERGVSASFGATDLGPNHGGERPQQSEKMAAIFNATVDPRPARKIALHVGLATGTVHNLISNYNRYGPDAPGGLGRGGRRRAHLARDEEAEFLEPFFEAARSRQIWLGLEWIGPSATPSWVTARTCQWKTGTSISLTKGCWRPWTT